MLNLLKHSMNKKTWLIFLLNIFLIIVSIGGNIAIPVLIGDLNGLYDPETGQLTANDSLFSKYDPEKQIWILVAIMVSIAIVSLISGVVSIYTSSKLSSYMCNNIRRTIFKNIQTFNKPDFDNIKPSAIINIMSIDVNYIMNALDWFFRVLIKSILIYIGSMVGISIIVLAPNIFIAASNNTNHDAIKIVANSYPNIPNWSIILMSIIASIGLFLSIIFISIHAIKYFKKSQIALDDLNEIVSENVIGQRTIKSFNLQKWELDRFSTLAENSRIANTRAGIIQSLTLPIIYFFLDITIILTTWLIPDPAMITQFGSILMLLGILLGAMIMSTIAFIQINRAVPSFRRVYTIINYKSVIQYPNIPSKLDDNLSIKFENVNFKYESQSNDEFVLKNLNFELNNHEVIGIIGKTSSGKSSLANLISRMYDTNSGTIKICNSNIKQLSKHQINDLIAYCPQTNFILSGTIEYNLKIAKPDATQIELDYATKNACAYEFINCKPLKYKTEISENGNNLSGGQKQRLMIARTLLKRSPILILDDVTTSLDPITEQNIKNTISANPNNQLVILISQKVHVVEKCKKIMVLKDGEIVGFDTHDNLLQNCEEYIDIYRTQNYEGIKNND